MILSASQPYFAPFPGFFHKARHADIFIMLDKVQFPQGTTWITRNRFKNDQGTLWMTIPVWKKGLGLQTIDNVLICHEGRWAKKHLASLKHAYAHAPYIGDHLDFFRQMFSPRYERLLDLNLAIIHHLLKHLAIDTRIRLQSETGLCGKGSYLLIDLCRHFGAFTFLAQQAAAKYLDGDLFRKSGIALKYVSPPVPIYPQLWGDFIHDLSVFDLLLNCGAKARDIALQD